MPVRRRKDTIVTIYYVLPTSTNNTNDYRMVSSNHFTHTPGTGRMQTRTMLLEEDGDGTLMERESTMRFSD